MSEQLSQSCHFYLKFSLLGHNYQTKFLSNRGVQTDFFKSVNMKVFSIGRTVFVNVNLANQKEMEQAFSKPLEIQLWFKKDSLTRYKQPEEETMLGSFFVEINELSKINNRRVKVNDGVFQAFEGYFSLYDFQKE